MIAGWTTAMPQPSDPPDDPSLFGDFLALECNPCFGLSVEEDENRDSSSPHGELDTKDDLRHQAQVTVRAARRQLEVALTDAVKFGRLLYRVRTSEPIGHDMVALWAETRGYIERQDGDRSAPLLDHMGRVIGLIARAGESVSPTPPITAIDLLQFEHVMRSVIAMVEVAAGAMELNWLQREPDGN